ncbi:MAG: alginate export family protein [Bacteroidales bacterium]|nr:alginate export family protein [Bacteroidales bacterium]
MKRDSLFLKIFGLFAMMFLLINQSFAQFQLSGEFRPRVEYRHGFKNLVTDDDKAAFQISQRTRLNAGYQLENMKFGLSLQDVRLWGETPQLVASSNRMMLHQAWAEYGFNEQFSIKVGRQELVYDDARIFGNVDWAQQARAHDLALLKYEKKFKLHVGLAFNQQNDLLRTTNYDMTSNYKTLQFLWYHRKIGKLGFSMLFLNNGMEFKKVENNADVYKTVFSQTIGTHLTYKSGKTSIYGNAYYSGGKDASDRKLSAYNTMIGLDFDLDNGFGLGAGWELLSGTSQKEKQLNANYTNKSFNPFYGTNHKFNGFMDYFYVGNHLNYVGLSDLFANVSYKTGKANFLVTVHLFKAANELVEPVLSNTLMDKGLGTEIDFSLAYKLNDFASLSAGYSQMFGTETLAVIRGGDYKATNNWAWLMVTFKPVFLK